MKQAVIVSTARTALAKSVRGGFNQTHGAVMGGHAVKHAIAKAGIEPGDVEDVYMGCGMPEGATGNNIALASPGSGIRDIFTGDDMPDNWGTKNTTYFFQTTLTATQFEAVQDGDALIETSFDTDNARKKAKDVQVGQVWAFRTQDGTYGLLLATAVTQGADGTVTFRVRTK